VLEVLEEVSANPAVKSHKLYACPDCGEMISREALKCPYCGRTELFILRLVNVLALAVFMLLGFILLVAMFGLVINLLT